MMPKTSPPSRTRMRRTATRLSASTAVWPATLYRMFWRRRGTFSGSRRGLAHCDDAGVVVVVRRARDEDDLLVVARAQPGEVGDRPAREVLLDDVAADAAVRPRDLDLLAHVRAEQRAEHAGARVRVDDGAAALARP